MCGIRPNAEGALSFFRELLEELTREALLNFDAFRPAIKRKSHGSAAAVELSVPSVVILHEDAVQKFAARKAVPLPSVSTTSSMTLSTNGNGQARFYVQDMTSVATFVRKCSVHPSNKPRLTCLRRPCSRRSSRAWVLCLLAMLRATSAAKDVETLGGDRATAQTVSDRGSSLRHQFFGGPVWYGKYFVPTLGTIKM